MPFRHLAPVFLLLVMLARTGANAEPLTFGQQGSFLLQGGIGYMYESSEVTSTIGVDNTSATHTVNVGPEFGYFIVDNFHFGIALKYLFTHAATEGGSVSNDSSVLIGLRPAYYIPLNETRGASVYLRGLIGYSGGNISNQDDSDDVLEFDYDGLAAGAGLGLAFAFGGDLGGVVQIGLDYLYRNVTTTIVDTVLQFDLVAHRITIGIDVGLYF